jgi:hypothetical protein
LQGDETLVFTNDNQEGEISLDETDLLVGEFKLRYEEGSAIAITQVMNGSGKITETEEPFDFALLLDPKPDLEEFDFETEQTNEDLDEVLDDPDFPDNEEALQIPPHEISPAEDLFDPSDDYPLSEMEQDETFDQAAEDLETEFAEITQPIEREEDDEEEDLGYEDYMPSGFSMQSDQRRIESEEPEQEAITRDEPRMADLEKIKAKAKQGLALGAGWLRQVEQKAESISAGSYNSMEDEIEEKNEMKPLTRVLIAVLVPLLLVFVSAMIFFNRGESHHYEYYLAQAKASISNAAAMQTKDLQREGWEQALLWLDQAADYQDSAEVKDLRLHAQQALDELDGARRLQYRLALSPSVYSGLDIGAIVSLNTSLYILDRNSGAVRLFNLKSNGYQMDQSFQCSPGTYNGISVGALRDVISIPINNPAKAPILAIDATGTLIYCSPGEQPTAVRLQAPQTAWTDLQAIAFDSNRLYVLDSANKNLWVYRGFTSNFDVEPMLLIDEDRLDLSQAIDVEANGEEFYVLHEDGHSSYCLNPGYAGVNHCNEPYSYADAGTGAEPLDFSKLKFSRFAFSSPPDPAIYFLEPGRAEIYQFSIRLNLNKVFRSASSEASLPRKEATAFYVAPDRRVFLAFGDRLYYAIMP